MGQYLPIHRANTAKASELADLTGVKEDLEESAKAMLASVRPENQDIARSLYVAALILYRRCFKNAVRHPIRNEHHIKINGTLEYHQYWMNLADKYAAHSVNAFEDAVVGVVINGDRVEGVGIIRYTLSNGKVKGAEDFSKYIQIMISMIINPMIERLTDEVFQEAQQVPASQHRRADQLILSPPGPEKAGVARKSRQR